MKKKGYSQECAEDLQRQAWKMLETMHRFDSFIDIKNILFTFEEK